MLVETRTVTDLDAAHRAQLTRSGPSPRPSDRHPVRLAIASTLVGWARRLVPDLPELVVLRIRGTPRKRQDRSGMPPPTPSGPVPV